MSRKKASPIFMNRLNEYKNNVLVPQNMKNSTGSYGKLFEVIIRHVILVNGIIKASDIRARGTEKVDCYSKQFGRVEIKSGSGAVKYGNELETFGEEDLTAENVLENANTVIWLPFPTFCMGDLFDKDLSQISEQEFIKIVKNIMRNTLVFESRETFVNCLECMGKNGIRSMLKVSKQRERTEEEKRKKVKVRGRQINIQTLSNASAGRMYDFIENEGIGTLDQYITLEK